MHLVPIRSKRYPKETTVNQIVMNLMALKVKSVSHDRSRDVGNHFCLSLYVLSVFRVKCWENPAKYNLSSNFQGYNPAILRKLRTTINSLISCIMRARFKDTTSAILFESRTTINSLICFLSRARFKSIASAIVGESRATINTVPILCNEQAGNVYFALWISFVGFISAIAQIKPKL